MVLAHDISKGNRTKDVKITQNITFETMLLSPETLQGLTDSGFHKPSPIQLYGIPIGKCGFDLLLEAKSGTGKTAVFTIIALEKLDFSKGLQVVILTPTREIAAQICDVLKQIGSKYKELQVEVVMGGLPVQDDIEKFKNPVHIVVGSPGRLRHLIQNKHIDTKNVRLLVLDEADKLMEGSFYSDIKFIHTTLPEQKQVIMSSATYPKRSRDLINSYVKNANHICPESDCVLLGIEQKVAIVKYNNNIVRQTQERFKELHKILSRLQFKQCLVFCNYQVRVAEVHKLLTKEDWPSERLYGQQEQVDRLDALKTLQQYKCRILVSTDVAARGIDVSNIDLVINFEPPYEWQTYLHRIGRAGRFGSYGLAITIVSENKEHNKFKEMLKSVDLPINMSNLWSNDEFNINIHQEPSNMSEATDILEKVSSKTMWELLSSESKANNFMETFESQSKLRENFENPKIEPFSELMFSLKDNVYQNTDEDIVYKHIEMKKTSADRSIVSINSERNDTINEELKKCNEVNCINTKETSKESTEISPKASIDNINKTLTNDNKTEENNNINETLLNLELPTMFSSSKFKSKDRKMKINKTISENKTHSNNYNIGNSKNKLSINNSQSQKNTEILTIDCDLDSKHYKREVHYKNKPKCGNNSKINNSNKKEHTCDNLEQQKSSFNMGTNKIEGSVKQKMNTKLYTNWYNQLKMRMKYIEQAVYIDEMSKI